MTQISKEYAEALFEIALEEDALAEYTDALDLIDSVLKEEPEYVEFLSSPAITLQERCGAIDEAFGDSVPENVMSFLKLLCTRGHMRSLCECIDGFRAFAANAAGKAEAAISSAKELTDGQKQAVIKKLEEVTGKTVLPTYVVDPSLIGGIKIEIEGKTWDGTIKHRLSDVKDVIIG